MTANELRKILSTKYDLVCSIGSDCGCAGHLVRNRLRRASYPLDWVGTWYNGIVGVAHLVESDFSAFLQLENLRREPNPPRAAQDDHDHDYCRRKFFSSQRPAAQRPIRKVGRSEG